jgi:hypothetical protein
MPPFTHPVLPLIAPVAGVIMGFTVFFLPIWQCDWAGPRVVIPGDRNCAYGHFLRFRQGSDPATWIPTLNGRECRSNDELARVLNEVTRHDVPVEVEAPANMPAALLVGALKELKRADVRWSYLTCVRGEE